MGENLNLEEYSSVFLYLREIAKKRGFSLDEYIIYLISRDEFIENSEEKVEVYLKLHEKYMKDADTCEKKADYVQASEKLWCSVTSLLSAIAEKRGWRHFSHRDYSEIIERLVKETSKPELSKLFASAERLHANHYHNFLVEESFKELKSDVEKLISILRTLVT